MSDYKKDDFGEEASAFGRRVKGAAEDAAGNEGLEREGERGNAIGNARRERSDVNGGASSVAVTAGYSRALLVSGLFFDRESAERAYRLLMERGYTPDDLDVVMSDDTRKAHFADTDSDLGKKALEGAGGGPAVGGSAGAVLAAIEAIGTSFALPGIGLLVAGPLAAALAGSGAGGLTGGLIGALVGSGINEERAAQYDRAVRGGGVYMSVYTRSPEDAEYFAEQWRALNEESAYEGPRGTRSLEPEPHARGSESTDHSRGPLEDLLLKGGTTNGTPFESASPDEAKSAETGGGGDDPDNPQKVTYHFRAEMEDEVLVQRVTTIQVTLSRDALGLETDEAAQEGEFKPDPQKKLIIQIVPQVNFDVVGEDRVEINLLTETEWPRDFYFDVRPTSVGSGEVWVMARQGQVSLAYLSLSPRIVETRNRKSEKVKSEAVADETPALSEPLHQLRIFEQRDGERVWFMYELYSPTLDIFDKFNSEPLRTERKDYVEHLYKRIEKYWLSTNADVKSFTRELRAFGGELFDELFPEKLRKILWKHRDELKSIMVMSTEPFIPWEMVHLKEPETSNLPDETKFLGQLGLVRWLHTVGWPPKQLKIREGRARYVIPQYPMQKLRLPEAEKESQFLRRMFSATPVEANLDAVHEVISKPGEFDLLHFACHGYAEQDNISNAGLMLQGRLERVGTGAGAEERYIPDTLSAIYAGQYSRLKAADNNRPLVVLNACQTGREGYSLTGIGGFAEAFLKGGAGAFVGTLWSVGDSPARSFTETLYRELRGEPGRKPSNLADAAIAAREKAREAGDATWLAYAVYGHPHMKVTG
jgi:hypothetical protein